MMQLGYHIKTFIVTVQLFVKILLQEIVDAITAVADLARRILKAENTIKHVP